MKEKASGEKGMKRTEILIGGVGGQGVILAGNPAGDRGHAL